MVRNRMFVASFKSPITATLLLLSSITFVAGAEWPQYRGPNHDGSTPERILTKWPSSGPTRLWKRSFNGGFSSFVAAQGRICTLSLATVDGVSMESCLMLDANSGKELWSRALEPAKYTGIGDDSGNSGAPGNRGGDGPRSTPSLDGDRAYVMSSRLKLFCLNATSGDRIWVKDLIREHGGTPIGYENAASPLIDGQYVFVAGGGPGQALLGIDKHDGRVRWKKHDDLLTHSTPVVTTVGGVRQIIFFTRSGLVAVSPETGERLWHYKFRFRVSAAISPVAAADLVYCSAGYGIGSAACQVKKTAERFEAVEIWRRPHNEPVSSAWSTPVHLNGYLMDIFMASSVLKNITRLL